MIKTKILLSQKPSKFINTQLKTNNLKRIHFFFYLSKNKRLVLFKTKLQIMNFFHSLQKT